LKFKGLDGRIYSKNINLDKHGLKEQSKSDAQHSVGKILSEMFPLCGILEEFPCFGTSGLHLDFFIPSLKIAFEYNGPQHEHFIQHFHKTKERFVRGKLNDDRKHRWCLLNGIKLIIIDDLNKFKETYGK